MRLPVVANNFFLVSVKSVHDGSSADSPRDSIGAHRPAGQASTCALICQSEIQGGTGAANSVTVRFRLQCRPVFYIRPSGLDLKR